MLDETIGFEAKAPVSLWNKRIGIDGAALFKAAAKGALAYFTANPAGAISAAIDGVFAIQTGPLKPEEQAWLLIQRALARAMAKLAAEAREREAFEAPDAETLLSSLDRSLAKQPIRIGQDFFDHPADHDLLDAVRPGFVEWLGLLGLSELGAEQITKRLGRYFTFSLHREWATHHRDYAELAREIESWNTPFAKADARERAWMRNAAWLQRQIEEPLFEETFGLCEVYVPLRAYWVERKADARRRITAEESLGPDREIRHVVDVRAALRGWLGDGDKDDAIRVISGGPGSGKSSSAKMLAAELAAAHDWRVLYVPLHQFDFAGDFRAAIRKFVIEDFQILDHDPLNSDEEKLRLIVFFDGLDELAMHGASGQEAASDFVAALDRAIGTINHRECRLQVVLGGREIVVQANERVFRRERQVLQVLPYVDPTREKMPRQLLLFREDLHDPDGLLAPDQRDLWWQKYGTASGRGHRCLPEPLRSSALIEISAHPLLNYLLALSFDRGRISFGPDLNLNELYEDLLDAVWERRWGEGRQLPEVERLEKSEFEQLLEEVGLAAWQAGTRGVAASRIAEICRDSDLDRDLHSFEAGAEKGALTLLAAFYFRQASRTGERTFEFTHKSFGEYLTARRLIAAVAVIADDRCYQKGKSRGQWDREGALKKWITLSGPAALDMEILGFLTREVALRAAEKDVDDRSIVRSWHETMVELFNHELNDGMPMLGQGLASFREMTRQARNAEETLLAAVFACASALFEATEADEPVRLSGIQWPEPFSARDLLTRLDQGYPRDWVTRSCLGWLKLDGANLVGADLGSANLIGANLEGANLNGAHLEGAHLVGADLERANLNGANLIGANLNGANLFGANLFVANLDGANLDGANLGSANLNGANLERADLRGVRSLDKSRGLDKVASWWGAKIERKWVERLGLDAEALGLEVDDVEEDQTLEN